MKKNILSLIAFSLLLSTAVQSQNLSQKLRAEQFISNSGDTLNYRILVPAQPDSTDTFPLVLFLHGAGERGSDNKAQLKWGVWRFAADSVQHNHPSIVVAPQINKGDYWADPDWRKKDKLVQPEKQYHSLSLVMQLLNKLQEDLPVDSTRLYVTGLSMGGFGTWNLITRYPHKFAAAVPVAGGGDLTKAYRLAQMPIWAFHGATDPIVPPKFTRQMVQAIRFSGGHPGYSEYPDVGHWSWKQAYAEPQLINWLFSKSKRNGLGK